MVKQQNSQSILSIFAAPVGLIAGATYHFRALIIFVKNPKLISYIIVPILINIIVGIILYVGLLLPGINLIESIFNNLSLQFDALISQLPTWLNFLSYLDNILDWFLEFIIFMILFLIIGFLLVQFGVILGSPFYGQLSEQLEKIKTGTLPEAPPGLLASIKDIWRAILFELKKIALFLGIGLPMLLLNFFPGGSLIVTIGGIILTTSIICLDFFDGPLERRKLRFREKLTIVHRSFPAYVTFGLICQALIAIPIVNFFGIPLCVAAGTLFCCDRVLPKLLLDAQP
ncbi:EI24 domain-containing protein [Okeania sp.]|uniref:EI24 domain-containing protein n=1 Tax=Okeania sp. TaxID=3100323 RepID=UPI002B4AEAA0|nr:EI24 domain-containing protein [Okeania sp.]MEB3341329.1 EI24 domain-containing protein [Okeania sp.]